MGSASASSFREVRHQMPFASVPMHWLVWDRDCCYSASNKSAQNNALRKGTCAVELISRQKYTITRKMPVEFTAFSGDWQGGRGWIVYLFQKKYNSSLGDSLGRLSCDMAPGLVRILFQCVPLFLNTQFPEGLSVCCPEILFLISKFLSDFVGFFSPLYN